MALLSLASSSVADRPRLRSILFLIGAFGAALFYGDGVITPAISVLSAVEGLEVATPLLQPYVLPITVGRVNCAFSCAAAGHGGIGAVFGPVMLLWFATLGIAGLTNIAAAPSILGAFNPMQALAFCLNNGWLAFVAFGAVVLAVTGGEALYADMGHFGAQTDSLGLVCLRASGANVELSGAGSAAAGESISHFKSVLSIVSLMGAISAR